MTALSCHSQSFGSNRAKFFSIFSRNWGNSLGAVCESMYCGVRKAVVCIAATACSPRTILPQLPARIARTSAQHWSRSLTARRGLPTIETAFWKKPGWETIHSKACMPPIEIPATAWICSRCSSCVSRRCSIATMSRMVNSGKDAPGWSLLLDGEEDTPFPMLSTAMT